MLPVRNRPQLVLGKWAILYIWVKTFQCFKIVLDVYLFTINNKLITIVFYLSITTVFIHEEFTVSKHTDIINDRSYFITCLDIFLLFVTHVPRTSYHCKNLFQFCFHILRNKDVIKFLNGNIRGTSSKFDRI